MTDEKTQPVIDEFTGWTEDMLKTAIAFERLSTMNMRQACALADNSNRALRERLAAKEREHESEIALLREHHERVATLLRELQSYIPKGAHAYLIRMSQCEIPILAAKVRALLRAADEGTDLRGATLMDEERREAREDAKHYSEQAEQHTRLIALLTHLERT